MEFLKYSTHEKTTLIIVSTSEKMRDKQRRVWESSPLVANTTFQSFVAQRQTENEMMRETHAEEVREWPTSPHTLPVDGLFRRWTLPSIGFGWWLLCVGCQDAIQRRRSSSVAFCCSSSWASGNLPDNRLSDSTASMVGREKTLRSERHLTQTCCRLICVCFSLTCTWYYNTSIQPLECSLFYWKLHSSIFLSK